MPQPPLHLLLIEDNPDDRAIVRRLLAAAPDGRYEMTEAESGAAGLAALRQQSIDCLLLDYRLPDYDGLEILRELRGEDDGLPVPVVMLTGTGNDRTVVEALQAGAEDYLSKSTLSSENLERAIANAIERFALRREAAAQRQRAAANERAAAALFQTAFTNSPVMQVISILETGEIIDVNQRLLEGTGFTREELVGRTAADLGLWVDPDQRRRAYEAGRAGQPLPGFETSFRLRDGSVRDMLLSLNAVVIDGAPRLLTALVDITERRRAERRQTMLHDLGRLFADSGPLEELLPAMLKLTAETFSCQLGECWLVDYRSMLIRRTAGWSSRPMPEMEYGKQDLAKGEGLPGIVWADQTPRWWTDLQAEVEFGRKDAAAALGLHSVLAVPVVHRGLVLGVLLFICTVSGEREAGEREAMAAAGQMLGQYLVQVQAEAALRASEQKFATAFRSSPLVLSITSLADGRFVEVNDTLVRASGYSHEELLGRTPVEVGLWVDPLLRDEHLRLLRAGRPVRDAECQFRMKDGAVRDFLLAADLMFLGGQPHVLSALTDITDRRAAERALQRREQQLHTVIAAMPVGVWLTDATGVVLQENEAARQVWGRSFVGPSHWGTTNGRDPSTLRRLSGGDWSLARTLRSGETVTNEVVDVETFNGAHKTILSAVAPVLDGQGGVAGAVVVNADISPIQRAQRALRESEERLSRLFDTSPDGIAMYDRDGRIALINAEGLRMLGLTGDVMTGAQAGKAPVRQLTLTGEPYPIERHPHYHLRASGEDSYHYELMVEQADGRRIIVSAIARPLRTPEGVFDGVVVVFRDVTEEKRTQEALRASEERLARLFQATPDGITVFDREGRIELMNSAAAALFGTTAEAMLGSVAGDTPERRFTLDGEPMPPERHSFFHLRASGVSFYRYDMLLERADGSRLIVTTTACPLRTPDGDFDGVIAVHRDITERRRVLDALRESEERLQMAARSAHFGVYDDRGAGNVYWSPELRQLFGVREGEDVQGAASAAQHIHPDDYTRWEAALTHARNPAGNGEMDSEHRIIRPDGSVIWVEQKGRIFFSGEGAERRGVRAIGLVADISHRKQDEERLRLLESVVVNTTDAVLITEAEPLELPGPRIIYVNQAFTDMTGYTLEDVLGKTPRILQGPGSDRAELDRLRRALQAWESCTVELRNYRKDGTEFWVNFSILPIADETGWFTHWISVQRDVTAQHEQEERRRFLIDLTDQLRLLTDADDIIRTVTHAIGTFFGVRCCSFDEIDLAADQIVCRNDLAYGPELAQPVLPFSLFAGPEVQADLTAGRIVAAADIAADARTSGQAAEIGPLNVRATALTPLLSEGRLTALLRLTSAEPRAWSAEELELLGTVADRTWTAVERARAEAAVRQSEQRMRLALDAAPGLVYEFDIVNNTAWRSEGVERLTGWRSEEIPEDADWWAQQVHPDDVVLIQHYTSEVQSIGTYSHEYRVRHRDGRWIWVWDRAQVEFGPNGEALRSLGATIDISERKNQEVRREFLADLSEQLRQQTDPEAIMRVATHALGRFFGVERCGFDDIDLAADRITEHTAATYGPPLSQLNVPFSGYAPATVLAELRRGRSLLINDVQRDHRFGDRRPALAALGIGAAMVVPLFHRGVLGGLLRVVTSAPREWTADEVALIQAVAERSWPLVEQARVQQALAEIDARLRLALETLQGLVYDYDIAQHTVWRSEGLERLLGWRPEEVADDPEWWNAQVHLADLVRVLTESQQTPETPVRSYEYRMRHRDGHWLWVWNVARMEFDAGGQPMRVLGVAVDISERKYAEERQRFLEDLSERLRQLTEPDDLARTATHALGAFLAVDSCAFDVFDLAGGRVMIGNDTGYGAPFPQEMVGFAEVEPPPFLAELRAGRLFASTDARTDPRFPVGQRAVQAFGMVAVVVAPLLRDGALVANLRLQVNQPRQWQPEDLDLIQTVADRAWLSIDRARAQQDLRERIEQLRQLGDNLPDGAVYQILSDRRGTSTFTYMSSGIERLTGVPAAEVLANGETLISCIGAEDQELTNAAFNRSAAELTPVDVEVRVNHRDGRLRWANLRAAPRRLADGSTVWDGVHIDITERKQAELELRASQERLQLALNAGSFGAWSWESGSQTVQWSPEVGTILGLPPERREGPLTALERITHPDDVGWVQETVRGAVARGEGFVIEPRVLLADSSEHWLYLAAQCLTDDDGRVQALVGLIADITERRRQQQHLEQLLDSEQTARRQAIEAVRLRDHVLATVTHDLKNPLAIIKGYSQVMQRLAARPGQELPASVNSGLIHIDQASAKMVAMLDELLDAARLQLGQPLVLNHRPTDLVALVRRSVASHGNTEDTHPITVETRESELVGDWDDTRIERVVDNLLSNAIKYSPDGGAITLRLRRETAAGRIQAVLIVSDQGMGIPAADLPHVFEPFRRAGNVGTAIPGTGIGLSGAKKIVEQHGGSLTAESMEGEGSTFTLRLPLDR